MDVLGYDGLYQASDLGRVRSLGNNKSRKTKILKPGKDRGGYFHVYLFKNKKYKHHLVHRLVYEAFNGEIPEGLQVNHINEDKTDNRLCNLNLMTRKENMNWGTHNQRVAEANTNGKLSVPLYQIIPETGQIVREWPSTAECGRNGFDPGSVSKCCNGKQKQHKGFIFRFKECINSL